MTDNDQTQNGAYVGGFTFDPSQGGAASGPVNPVVPTPPTPPTPPSPPTPPMPAPVAAAPAPVAPAPAAPVYQAPMPPAPPMPMASAAPMAPMAPMAGMGDPYAGGGGAMGGAQPPADPNYLFGEKMKSFTTSVKLPAHSLKFDEDRFLNLLAGSISLSKDEKKKIIESIPKLRQEQVDELVRIFEEERTKFVELSPKHGPQLKKLEEEHAADWRDIEIAIKAEARGQEDQSKADEIRKQLGL